MKEAVYTPLVPTSIVTGQSGNVKVVCKYYGGHGPMTHDEVVKRAISLDPAKLEKPRERVYFVDEDDR
jgi:hypothetical protein